MGLRRTFVALVAVALASTIAGLGGGAVQKPAGFGASWTLHAAPPTRYLPIDSDQGPAEAPADLYGNPLRPAVATYDYDAFGGTVEEHYPETRVSKLSAPEG